MITREDPGFHVVLCSWLGGKAVGTTLCVLTAGRPHCVSCCGSGFIHPSSPLPLTVGLNVSAFG